MIRRLLPLLLLIVLMLLSDIAFGQKDTISLKPTNDGICCWDVTIKNRNTAGTSIDEVNFTITSADGSSMLAFDQAPGSQWKTETTGEFTAKATAEVSNIPAGGDKLIGTLCLDIPNSIDKVVRVTGVTKNSTTPISTLAMEFICTPTQGNKQDSFSVVPSLSGTDPLFTFTVYNKNGFYNIHRFVAKLISTGGTMRPSKITAPGGWLLDSVTTFAAYFSALSNSDDIIPDNNLGGFKVCLRGNPAIKKFDFAVSTNDPQNIQISRDTLRNIPITFTGSAAESDVVTASVQSGCLYELTVKNYHVSNPQPPSRIRKVALWVKTAGITFNGAPSAPVGWTKTEKSDSIIYTASADSLGIPSGRIEKLFKFIADGPTASGYTVGWNTYKNLVDVISTGDLSLMCTKENPKKDTATIESPSNCFYAVTFKNLHNTPASDLKAVQVSIPPFSGKLADAVSVAGWNVVNVDDQTVRFTAPAGSPLSTGSSTEVGFSLAPTVPGQNIILTWKTYDDAALTSGTPTATDVHTINCTPIVSLCDKITSAPVAGDTCSYNYSFQNLRDTTLNNIKIEVFGGWTIDTAFAPAGWKFQLQNGRKLAEYTHINADGGIPKNTTLDGFILKYSGKKPYLDTFYIIATRNDPKGKLCEDRIDLFDCKVDTTSSSVAEPFIAKASVTVRPNPVTQDATLDLRVERQGRVIISLLDVLGNEVLMLKNSILTIGEHHFPFSMKSFAPGSYYLRIQTLGGVITQKVILM